MDFLKSAQTRLDLRIGQRNLAVGIGFVEHGQAQLLVCRVVPVDGAEPHLRRCRNVLVIAPLERSKGGKLLRLVRIVIAVRHVNAAVLVENHLGNTGVVAPADLHHVLGAQTQRERQNAANGRAVAHKRNGISGLFARNAAHFCQRARTGFHNRLAVRRTAIPRVRAPSVIQLRIINRQLCPRFVLPVAHVNFAQGRAFDDGQLVRAGDCHSGESRAPQITGIHRVQIGIGKALADNFRLLQAAAGEHTVIVAVAAAA